MTDYRTQYPIHYCDNQTIGVGCHLMQVDCSYNAILGRSFTMGQNINLLILLNLA